MYFPTLPLGRRAFMTFVGGALAGVPISAFAQEMPLVGVLMGLSNDAESQGRLKAFTSGLAEQGWSVGKTLRFEYRFSESDFQRKEALAKELVTLRPSCILGHSTPVVRALMRATRTIPIVFVAVRDPVPKTAKDIGLVVPRNLLVAADRLVE